jgi:hypothetical protein
LGAAVDYLRVLAKSYPLDLSRTVVIGHSAGAHAALWVAARSPIPADSDIYSADPLRIQAAVAIDGTADLADFAIFDAEVCRGLSVVVPLMGGTALERPERYRQASPQLLLPLGVPQFLVTGPVFTELRVFRSVLPRRDDRLQDTASVYGFRITFKRRPAMSTVYGVKRRRQVPVFPLADYMPAELAELGVYVGRLEGSLSQRPNRKLLHRHDHFELFWYVARTFTLTISLSIRCPVVRWSFRVRGRSTAGRTPRTSPAQCLDLPVCSSTAENELADIFGEKLPARRVGRPQDLAQAYIFAMQNPYLTGQSLIVDGRRSRRMSPAAGQQMRGNGGFGLRSMGLFTFF